MSNKTVKVKKKRFNFKKFFIFCLFIYIVIYSVYCIFNEPIRHIMIRGNNFVSDIEIIEIAKLKNYPSIFKYLSSTIEKRIEKLELVKDAKVKKKWGFVLQIDIEENKPLFYNSTNDKVYLSNGEIVEKKIIGIPTLGNYVKDDVLEEFIKTLKDVDLNILYEVNEIYYDPSYNEHDEVIDNERFRLMMSDGNQVYLTAERADKLNYYNEIYASINDKKGSLFLDSGDYGNFGFTPYGSD